MENNTMITRTARFLEGMRAGYEEMMSGVRATYSEDDAEWMDGYNFGSAECAEILGLNFEQTTERIGEIDRGVARPFPEAFPGAVLLHA